MVQGAGVCRIFYCLHANCADFGVSSFYPVAWLVPHLAAWLPIYEMDRYLVIREFCSGDRVPHVPANQDAWKHLALRFAACNGKVVHVVLFLRLLMEALITGLSNLMDPSVLIAMVIGSVGGVLIGAVPGIGPAITAQTQIR